MSESEAGVKTFFPWRIFAVFVAIGVVSGPVQYVIKSLSPCNDVFRFGFELAVSIGLAMALSRIFFSRKLGIRHGVVIGAVAIFLSSLTYGIMTVFTVFSPGIGLLFGLLAGIIFFVLPFVLFLALFLLSVWLDRRRHS